MIGKKWNRVQRYGQIIRIKVHKLQISTQIKIIIK